MDTNAIQILHTMILKKTILVTVQKAFWLRIKIAKIVISISGDIFFNINLLKSPFLQILIAPKLETLAKMVINVIHILWSMIQIKIIHVIVTKYMPSKTKTAQIVNTLYFGIIFKNNYHSHSFIKIHIVPK